MRLAHARVYADDGRNLFWAWAGTGIVLAGDFSRRRSLESAVDCDGTNDTVEGSRLGPIECGDPGVRSGRVVCGARPASTGSGVSRHGIAAL